MDNVGAGVDSVLRGHGPHGAAICGAGLRALWILWIVIYLNLEKQI